MGWSRVSAADAQQGLVRRGHRCSSTILLYMILQCFPHKILRAVKPVSAKRRQSISHALCAPLFEQRQRRQLLKASLHCPCRQLDWLISASLSIQKETRKEEEEDFSANPQLELGKTSSDKRIIEIRPYIVLSAQFI